MLPTQKRKKLAEPNKINIALYGANGIGKTTWANQAEDALIIAVEPGHNAIEGYIVEVKTWDEFRGICAEVKSGNHKFRTVVLDTAPGLYRLLQAKICAESNVNHVSKAEGGYGRGIDIANNMFYSFVQELAYLPFGLILIGHAQEKIIKPPAGQEYTKMVMDLPEKNRSQILGLFDVVLYAKLERFENAEGMMDWKRVLKTQPHPSYEARDRFNYLPATIDLNYQAFVDAFIQGRDFVETNKESESVPKTDDNETNSKNNPNTGLSNQKKTADKVADKSKPIESAEPITFGS